MENVLQVYLRNEFETIQDYNAFAGEMAGLRRKDALTRAHEVLYYVGLDEARYRPVDQYSTGMRQRIANYPGITTEAKAGKMSIGGQTLDLLDLPPPAAC